MRKELVWAGIIGILFGVVIGFGVWRVRSKVTLKNEPIPTSSPQSGLGQFKITIDKPENLGVVTESPVSVSGITKSSNWIIVSTDEEDYITKSLEDGTFSVDVDLKAGINHIMASSINLQGNIASQKILSVYSESFQTSTPTPETATSEADIKKAVALKIAQAEKPPRAYIGIVTDIAESTIQIKSTDSQIQQISTNKLDIVVVNVKGTTNKIVKLADIAIGDFIVAMGYIDDNDVLDVQRILIADSPIEPKIGIYLQRVKIVGKNSLDLINIENGESVTITPGRNTVVNSFTEGKLKIIKLSGISESGLIITASDISVSPAIIRSLYNLGSVN